MRVHMLQCDMACTAFYAACCNVICHALQCVHIAVIHWFASQCQRAILCCLVSVLCMHFVPGFATQSTLQPGAVATALGLSTLVRSCFVQDKIGRQGGCRRLFSILRLSALLHSDASRPRDMYACAWKECLLVPSWSMRSNLKITL